MPAEPAHGDHADPHDARRASDRGAGQLERPRDRYSRDRADRVGDQVGIKLAQQVGGRGAEQLPAADREQPGHRALAGCLRMPAQHSFGLGMQRIGLPRGQQGVIRQHRDRIRGAQQQVGGIPAGGEQPSHPPRDVGVVTQQPQVPR